MYIINSIGNQEKSRRIFELDGKLHKKGRGGSGAVLLGEWVCKDLLQIDRPRDLEIWWYWLARIGIRNT